MITETGNTVPESAGLENFAQGYAVRRLVFGGGELEAWRAEADRVAHQAGSACVRNIRSKSPLFARLPELPEVKALLGRPELRAVRSILFDKTPGQNWPVAWHQDLTIAVKAVAEVEGYGPWTAKDGVVHVQPPIPVLEAMLTVRIHLDDAPEDNGALYVVPGSHKKGRIPAEALGRKQEGTLCACEAGDVLVMSPLLLHSSRRSLRPSRRRILHFEFAEPQALDPRLAWHEEAGII